MQDAYTAHDICSIGSGEEVAALTSAFVEGTLSADALFGSLGSDIVREYENATARLASTCTDRPALTRKITELLSDPQAGSPNARYGMFYCLNVCLRYDKNTTDAENAFGAYGDEFKTRPSFGHLRLLAQLQKDFGLFSDDEVDDLIQEAFASAQRAPGNQGYPHLFADLVATACEKARGERLDQLKEAWLQRAIDMCSSAIRVDPEYAKFYCTLGRLQAQAGEFSAAQQNIGRAIDLEKSERTDYAVRIGSYQAALINVRATEVEAETRAAHEEMLADMQRVTSELEKAKEEIESSKTSNLEFLGFFTALISFTIGSIGLVQDATPLDAAGIIVVLAGALLLAFAGFTFIILRKKEDIKRKAIPMAIAGLVILIFGFIWLSIGH